MFRTLWGPSVSTDDINSSDNVLESAVSRVRNWKSGYTFVDVKGETLRAARGNHSNGSRDQKPCIFGDIREI